MVLSIPVDQLFMGFFFFFHRAVFEKDMTHSISAWFSDLSAQPKSKAVQLMQTAWEMIGVRQHASLQSIYEQATLRQASRVITDPSPCSSH